jgi:hypothetical protein
MKYKSLSQSATKKMISKDNAWEIKDGYNIYTIIRVGNGLNIYTNTTVLAAFITKKILKSLKNLILNGRGEKYINWDNAKPWEALGAMRNKPVEEIQSRFIRKEENNGLWRRVKKTEDQ